MNLSERVAQTRSLCESALSSAALAPAADCLERAGVDAQAYHAMLRAGDRLNRAVPDLTGLWRNALAKGDISPESFAFERALLVRTALSTLGEVQHLPVDDSVKHLFCREFAFYANPPDIALPRFALDGKLFSAMGGIVALSRFPAGQYQWVVSGFPRSWLFRIAPVRLPELAYFLAVQFRGFGPCFVPHVAATMSDHRFLTEREYFKTFYRMAAALEKQPAIRGIMAGSWMHSRETHRVSAHLAFFNRPYIEAGGICLDRGPASPTDGFLSGDPVRASLYQTGEYKPTFGLVFCTRGQAIAWKYAHPEFEQLLHVR